MKNSGKIKFNGICGFWFQMKAKFTHVMIWRVVQYCDIMRFMILWKDIRKCPLTPIFNKIVTVLQCMKNGTLCDTNQILSDRVC